MMFDIEKYYLGKLCPHGHDFNGTGKSLRYKKNWNCKECSYISVYSSKSYVTNGVYDSNKARRRYLLKNPGAKKYKKHKSKEDRLKHNKHKAQQRYERLKNDPVYMKKQRERQKRYRLDNPEKYTFYMRFKNQRERENLKDVYVKKKIYADFKYAGHKIKMADITQEMVEIKKEQLLIYRLIKEVKHGLTGTRN